MFRLGGLGRYPDLLFREREGARCPGLMSGEGYPTYPMMHVIYLPPVGIKKPCLCLYELELINSSSPPAKATNLSKEIYRIAYNAAVFVLNFVIKIFVSVNLGEIIF